jgi:hypothetical protein
MRMASCDWTRYAGCGDPVAIRNSLLYCIVVTSVARMRAARRPSSDACLDGARLRLRLDHSFKYGPADSANRCLHVQLLGISAAVLCDMLEV